MYIRTKLSIASIYEGGPVPELVTHITGLEQDFVQLSSLDMLTKSCISDVAHYHCIFNINSAVTLRFVDLVIGLLAMHIAWRAWRYPDEAVSLQTGFPLCELHIQRPQVDIGGFTCKAMMVLHAMMMLAPTMIRCMVWNNSACCR